VSIRDDRCRPCGDTCDGRVAHVLAYSHVCSRMLTYAHVCSPCGDTCDGRVAHVIASSRTRPVAQASGPNLLCHPPHQHTSAYVSKRQHTLAYASIRQHTSAYVSIRQHTSACLLCPPLNRSPVCSMRRGKTVSALPRPSSSASSASVFVLLYQ
jgi:hypothetical protein